jgi:hypothetical protein
VNECERWFTQQFTAAQFSGSWNDLTDKPTNISTWTNDAGYQTAVQLSTAISNALAASGFQTAAQVEALIEAALTTLDTEIFVVVSVLPDPATADPNKIYLVPNSGGGFDEYHVRGGAWDLLGSTSVDLTGYFNEQNLVPISNAEIDQMITSLAP